VHVHNQCSDFELVSPVYFGKNAIWHILPDEKVDINTMTRASFRRDASIHGFESALIYEIQRKNIKSNDQSNVNNTKEKSTSIQLLVILRRDDSGECSIRAVLIKHSVTITWDEDTLEKLYSIHLALLRSYDIKSTWLLDGETVLVTASKWRSINSPIEITISEGIRDDTSTEPLWVSSSM
jgi:hypothetical protein